MVEETPLLILSTWIAILIWNCWEAHKRLACKPGGWLRTARYAPIVERTGPMATPSLNADDGGHIMYVCPKPCIREGCWTCDGGLYLCTRCNLLEGALTSECPGSKVSPETADKVYRGIMDFKRECWLIGHVSPHSPQHAKN